MGPEDESGPWYFSLNNRRLWVLKRCREEGLLENNVIRVRKKTPKSESELMERYTLTNCALEAKFLREKDPKVETQATGSIESSRTKDHGKEMEYKPVVAVNIGIKSSSDNAVVGAASDGVEEDDTETESDEECDGGYVNPFSALM